MKETSTWISAALAVIWFMVIFGMVNTSMIQSSGFPIKTGIVEFFGLVFTTRIMLFVNYVQRKNLLKL